MDLESALQTMPASVRATFQCNLREALRPFPDLAPSPFLPTALKSHTSKLQSYDGIVDVSSFGFRGEALSSLCQLADVAITTRTEEESAATILLFDRQGNVRPKPGKTARTVRR